MHQGVFGWLHPSVVVLLAAAVVELLQDRDRAAAFGVEARRTVERTYDLKICVQRQLALMDLVASGSINT